MWQPIETAPKDGSEILLFNSLGNRHIGRWGHRYLGDPIHEGWTWDGKQIGGDVTHWMPLPAPPTT